MSVDYLENNAKLLSEAGQNLQFARGKIIGDTGQTRFTAVGEHYSDIAGRILYFGLKEYYFHSNPLYYYQARSIADLAIIRKISKKFPYLAKELPFFYWLLQDSNGQNIGILTEDFSEGGRYEVDAVNFDNNLPQEIKELIPDISNEEMRKICFEVNGQRRLGDFNTMLTFLSLREREEVFPCIDILKDIDEHDKYTSRLSYPLV